MRETGMRGALDPDLPEGRSGVDRRTFIKQICILAAGAVGLPAIAGEEMAQAAAEGLKPSVIWLHFQECTGCTESLLRTSHPTIAKLILEMISLDYHETLFAAAGNQIEDALKSAMEAHKGKYICVVEGAIPTKDGGIYCKIGGRTALEMLNEVAEHAGAIVAIGSCASFGGIPAADPNPTGAKGAPEILAGKTVVSIPGCPPNPYNFLGTVLQYVTFGTLPALDELGRPKFAYGRLIHEHCPRRPHFDAGRFANQFGDEGHRLGYCLYALGCKGPQTHANCPTQQFGEVNDAWPIGIGHPCVGCTEQKLLWRTAIHETIQVDELTPSAGYPPLHADHGGVSPVATGLVGLVGGGLIGAGLVAAKKLTDADKGQEEGS
jgi:hydrogenase small subunit